jgi:AraC-like DNA-binding protein
MLVTRAWHHIERSASDEYFIGLHLRGVAFAHQDGRAATLLPGDFALFDSGRPYTIKFHNGGPFDHLILRVPRDLLESRCAHLDHATAIAVKAGSDAGRLASPSLTTLASLAAGAPFVDPILDLLARALTGSAGLGAPPPSRRQQTLRELKRYTVNHLGDTELSPTRVANACFISVRQLHRLFALDTTTFGEFVKESRLRNCRRDLADPNLATLTIAEIARHRGFPTAALFTRAFTERYETGPRAFRQARQHETTRDPSSLPQIDQLWVR